MGRAFIIPLFFIGILAAVGLYVVTAQRQSPTGQEAVATTTTQSPTTTQPMQNQDGVSFSITSSQFAHEGMIPSYNSCDGEGISPPLSFMGVPSNAGSLALIVEDPDVPKNLKPDGLFVHWILFNIPPATRAIAEGGVAGVEGHNSTGKTGYAPPCPPPQYEPSEHRYIFTLYALDTELPLELGATHDELIAAMQGHIIDKTQLIGKYRRQK